jgi:hypothetical protein
VPGGVTAPPAAAPRGTWRAPRRGVRHLIHHSRVLATRAIAVCLTAGAALAALAGAADAQIASVPTPPRPRRVEPVIPVSPDSATRAARTSAATPEAERQRLDIQAWVDSAAGALARSAPPSIPPPGSAARPSIFSEPAVPDSLRPPAAPARGARPRAARARRP